MIPTRILYELVLQGCAGRCAGKLFIGITMTTLRYSYYHDHASVLPWLLSGMAQHVDLSRFKFNQISLRSADKFYKDLSCREILERNSIVLSVAEEIVDLFLSRWYTNGRD